MIDDGHVRVEVDPAVTPDRLLRLRQQVADGDRLARTRFEDPGADGSQIRVIFVGQVNQGGECGVLEDIPPIALFAGGWLERAGSLAWIHSAATGAGGRPYSGPTLSPFCSHWCGPVVMHPRMRQNETARRTSVIDRTRLPAMLRRASRGCLDLAESWLAAVLRLSATIRKTVAIGMERTNRITELSASGWCPGERIARRSQRTTFGSPARPLALLGGDVGALFGRGGLHQEDERDEHNCEHGEQPEGVEVGQRDGLLLAEASRACRVISCAAAGSPVCWRKEAWLCSENVWTAGLNGSRNSPTRALWNCSRRSHDRLGQRSAHAAPLVSKQGKQADGGCAKMRRRVFERGHADRREDHRQAADQHDPGPDHIASG